MEMKRVLPFILGSMFGLIISAKGIAFAQWGGGYGWGHGPWMMGGGYGGRGYGGIFMIIFWIAVIVGIIFLVRWLVQSSGGGSHGAKSGDSALEILKRRYAEGEIDKKEFEQKKKDLG
jgi:putative membrane protein